MAAKRFWKIEVHDGGNQTFEKLLPAGCLTETGAIALLQRLAAMHLNEEEIIASSLRRNARGYRPLLEHQIYDPGGSRRMIVVNAGREFYASIWSADELPNLRE